ncbi:diacylglycerol kinase family lipid kinase [soil metagenome]
MEQGSIGVILNPASSGGKTIKLLPIVTALFARSGRAHDIYVTARAGETDEVAKQMIGRNHDILVAIGGDGTINEVGSAILADERDVTLGIIPSGNGSDFVRTLGLPKSTPDAVSLILKNPKSRIDAGSVTFDDGESKYFLNVAGLGFDSIVAEYTIGSRLPGSTLPYIVSVLKAMRVYKNMMMRVESPDFNWEGRAASVLVANAKYVAGGMKIAPMAEIDDGKVDLAVLGDLSNFEMIRATPGLYSGKHTNHPKFTHRATTELRVTTERPVRVQVDGELSQTGPATFKVLPGALSILK